MEAEVDDTRTRWREIGPDEAERIEEVVREAGTRLRALGFETRTPHFPFVLHHVRYRTRLKSGGRKLRHSEVAGLLNAWASSRPSFAEAYAWQAVCGAAEALAQKAGTMIPEGAFPEAAHWLGHPGFEQWARAELKRGFIMLPR